jgi:putative transposase
MHRIGKSRSKWFRFPGNAEPQLGEYYKSKPMTDDSNNTRAELGLSVPRKEWYSRGYLPHRDQKGLLQAVTFRLADSLPQEKLKLLEDELSSISEEKRELERRRQIESWLDAGMGCCALGSQEVAKCMEETLLLFDGDKYTLIAWCIMPNHVHVLIEPKHTLSRIVQSWKSYTGRWISSQNDELNLGITCKSVWMREYWDRYIRDENHYRNVIDYIHQNPVKAGLCAKPADWRWSSAWVGRE